MEHVWSIICEKSAIDFETNLLSMFNCLEEIKLVIDKTKMSLDDKIVIPVNFQIVSFWSIRDFSKSHSLVMKGELIDPDGLVLNKFTNNLEVKEGIKRFRNRTNIQGMPVTKEGRYYFKIYQKETSKFEEIAKLPLDIELAYKILDNKEIQK